MFGLLRAILRLFVGVLVSQVGKIPWFNIVSFGIFTRHEVFHGLTGISSSVRTVNFVGITLGYDFQYFLFAKYILFCPQN